MEFISIIEDHHDGRQLQATAPAANGVNSCVRSSSLTSTFKADTVAIGTMFTIQTKDEAIRMETMELSANPVNREMHVEIYTRMGEFKGFEGDPSQWIIITNATVTPAREGRGTLIPVDQFQSFDMQPNELRSIYVTLRTNDLRYTRAPAGSSGTFTSDGYLKVNMGIGLAEYQFSRKIFLDRVFNGIFHYTHATDCLVPKSKTLLPFTFHIRSNLRPQDALKQTDVRVEAFVKSLIQKDLKEVLDAHNVEVESIETGHSTMYSQDGSGCPVDGWKQCLSIDSNLMLSHLDSINGGNVRFIFLEKAMEVAQELQREMGWEVSYGGKLPMYTSIFIALKGVPAGLPMDDIQQLYFEQVLTEYLERETLGMSNAAVIGTRVALQRGPSFTLERRTQRTLQQQVEPTTTTNPEENWIEMKVHVLAEHQGPYVANVPFADIIRGSFRFDREGLLYDLQSGTNRPGSLVNGARGLFFSSVSQISTRDPTDVLGASFVDRNADSSPLTQSIGKGKVSEPVTINGMDVTLFSFLCLFGIIFATLWIWFFFIRKPKKKKQDPETYDAKDSKKEDRVDLSKQNVVIVTGSEVDLEEASSKKDDGSKSDSVRSRPSAQRHKQQQQQQAGEPGDKKEHLHHHHQPQQHPSKPAVTPKAPSSPTRSDRIKRDPNVKPLGSEQKPRSALLNERAKSAGSVEPGATRKQHHPQQQERDTQTATDTQSVRSTTSSGRHETPLRDNRSKSRQPEQEEAKSTTSSSSKEGPAVRGVGDDKSVTSHASSHTLRTRTPGTSARSRGITRTGSSSSVGSGAPRPPSKKTTTTTTSAEAAAAPKDPPAAATAQKKKLPTALKKQPPSSLRSSVTSRSKSSRRTVKFQDEVEEST